MKIGIIAPIKFLEEFCITDIQYYLPTLIVENKKYRDFCVRKLREKNTVIMDMKKIGWKREPEDPSIIDKALNLLIPSIIILPSYMFNTQKTTGILDSFKFRNITTYGCLEGTNMKEVQSCIEEFKDLDGYAIPSHMYGICTSVPQDKPIIYIENHLSIDELKAEKGILVTSLPIRLGLEGRLLSDYRPSPPSLTFYEEENKYPSITKKNIEEIIGFYK